MSKFDFAKSRASAKKMAELKKLQLIMLGHSGSGKSYSIGTLGVKTLYIFGTKESHGPASARGAAADAGYDPNNIQPYCVDYGVWPGEEEAREFTADESMEFITALLKDTDYLKSEKIGCIALDSLSVLEAIVKDTALWKEKCKTTQGKHNTFKETEASQEIMGSVIDMLKYAQQEIDCHIVVTGIIDVKEKDGFGAVVEAVPRLGGYGLCENMIQHFFDVVVVGKMVRSGVVKYKFQFGSDLTKAAKDEHGTIKKMTNFSPRLTGCVPESMYDADLSILAKVKGDRK